MMLKRILSLSLILGIVFFSKTAPAEVYISAEKAVKEIFPEAQEFNTETRSIDNQEFKIFTALKMSETLGWAVVVEEMGKIKPITFLIGIDKQGKVFDVYILEYRDMFGSEIKRRSFLRQFQGKSVDSFLRVGADIDAVTQATISSAAAAAAVKKSLHLISELKK
mgnify:CR=1 FL=1